MDETMDKFTSSTSGTVIAVCWSREKGTSKDSIGKGVFKQGYGLADDAHADCSTHRQVSLLATESIDKMKELGLNLKPGDFAENLTTSGIDLVSLPTGTEVKVGDEVTLEISQIGKKCHTGCAILQKVGNCIMPKEGIFARVIHGGLIQEGDTIQTVKP